MNEKSLLKQISGNASDEESALVFQWLEKSPENRKVYNRLKNSWVMANLPNRDADPRGFVSLVAKSNRRRSMRIAAAGVAVAAIVTLTVMFGMNKLDYYASQSDYLAAQDITQLEYSTNKGVKGRIVLPDGSVVWLNSDSRIKCPSKFKGDLRELEFCGEGFFEVVKDTMHPMVISLGDDIFVKVTGTRFNLSSYSDDNEISALLVDGKISITKNNVENNVKPNEQISIKKQETHVKTDVPKETQNILGWKDGWLIFDDTPMELVLKKMERWYGVQFVVSDKLVLQQKFTAKFKEESASQILDMMNSIAMLNYEVKDSIVYLSRYIE